MFRHGERSRAETRRVAAGEDNGLHSLETTYKYKIYLTDPLETALCGGMFGPLGGFSQLAGAQLGEYSPRRRSAGSATPAEGRRRSGEDGDLLGGDSRSAESRSLEGRQEAGYLLLATT